MIKFGLKWGVEVWVDSDEPNTPAKIEWSGEEFVVEDFRKKLRYAHGAFGHLIGTSASPIDLHAALMQEPLKSELRPELLEGAELVERYDPGIPDGAKT